MKAMSVKYKMLSDKNNIDNDRLYRPAALSELLEAWLAVFESRRSHRGDGKHNRQSPDTADTYQNWPGMINLSHRFTQIITDFIWFTKTEIHLLCFLLQYGLTKTKINPLRLMQVSYEPWMAQPSENPWASSDIFSQLYHHPTVHQPQGDKQKINISSVA